MAWRKKPVPWHMDRRSRMVRIDRRERIAWIIIGILSFAYLVGMIAKTTGLWKGF